MKRRDFLKTLGGGAAVLTALPCRSRSPRLPNFVIIFTDDQGYADLGCYGARDFQTPHIDRMAAEGMRFSDFYVAQAVCSASRAALLTGCYPNRVSILGALMPQATHGIHSDEETLAEVLKKRGYACGIFGKWHLGHHLPFLPLQHGFDEYLGIPYSNDMWPLEYDGSPSQRKNKTRHPPLPLVEGNKIISRLTSLADQDRLTTLYTERAVRFIENHRDQPFFLYVPHSMPHTPLGVSDKFRGRSRQGPYGDVIMEIDWSVGEILKTLKKCNLDKTTLVIYTSDNGPWLNFGKYAGSAGPLREGKGSSWEGGIRVPCIMRWPDRIPAGSECRKIAATIDLLPTLAEFAEAPLPERKIDGISLVPLLLGDQDAEPRKHFVIYYGKQLQCVREGPWKLLFPHRYRSYEGVEPGTGGHPGLYNSGETGLELYNLETDIGERNNVAERFPHIVRRLQELAAPYREALGDQELVGNEVRPAGRIE